MSKEETPSNEEGNTHHRVLPFLDQTLPRPLPSQDTLLLEEGIHGASVAAAFVSQEVLVGSRWVAIP
jgi:hypothetical protein